jgi:hypothetical protein
MKNQANKGRTDSQFDVGDMVFLKLHPYIQFSPPPPRCKSEVSFKFFGPFKVLQRVGSVAYKLDLLPSLSVHPVFHVSKLKRAVGAGV